MALNKDVFRRPFEKEYFFQTSRSSGPGGQHVNKSETRVELRFFVDGSALLSENEKETIKTKLSNKMTAEGFLQIFAQEYRSQAKNKELAEKRFYHYLGKALKKKKKRIPTKPSKQAKEKRLTKKKQVGEKKARRAGIDFKTK